MIEKPKLLYLYSEVVGYLIPIFKTLIENYNAEIVVIHWDKKKLKPYIPEEIEGLSYMNRSEFDRNSLNDFCFKFNPDLVYVSGWMDKDYLSVTKVFKKNKIPVVVGFDDIWVGNLRQRIGAFVFPFLYAKYFSHAWVAGSLQFEFARRLGFKSNDIIFDLLSANTFKYKFKKESEKAFLYVGNFREVKGTDILIQAFKKYQAEFKGSWKLICVGNGEMASLLEGNSGVEVFPYATELELLEISKKASVFILPSRHDQWGVVVHEFAALGMPLLLSENVGAKASFFIKGFNGLMYFNNSANDLAEKMLSFEKLEDAEIQKMSHNSTLLSSRITPETSAANLMSIL